MSLSSKVFPGLRTAKATFVTGNRAGDLDVAQWVKVEQDEGELEGDGWGEDEIVAEASGWWAGHHTGATACKVTSILPPYRYVSQPNNFRGADQRPFGRGVPANSSCFGPLARSLR